MPAPIIALRRGLLGAASSALSWLLRDEFTTDATAPLASPRTAEPGPGTLTLVQNDGQFSLASGVLNYPAQSSPVEGDLGWYGAATARAAGRALFVRLTRTTSATYPLFGWSTVAASPNSSPLAPGAWFGSAGSITVRDSATAAPDVIVNGGTTTGVAYDLAFVLTTAGGYVFIKGGAFTAWTLLWRMQQASPAATLYPAATFFTGTGTVDAFRVADLGGPFATDYGLATSRIAGTVTGGATFTHEASAPVYFTVTTLPSSGTIDVSVRGGWLVRIDSAGAYSLIDPTAVSRGSSTGVTAGARMGVIMDGSTIRVYRAGNLGITYPSATANQTSTTGSVASLGTGGAVSDVECYPRTMSGDALTWLNRLAA